MSTFLFIVLLPLTLVVTFLLWIDLGNPFFRQERVGKDLNRFKIIKFRTMNNLKDDRGLLLPDAERITKIGNWVRKTSIDEIPQLLNIMAGDMSFIGPRPLLIEYLPLYSGTQIRRHDVKPGISGWAQVNGRNNITWKEKFEHDVWYVDHGGFWMDLKILGITLVKVLKAEGISLEGQVTTIKFNGQN